MTLALVEVEKNIKNVVVQDAVPVVSLVYSQSLGPQVVVLNLP